MRCFWIGILLFYCVVARPQQADSVAFELMIDSVEIVSELRVIVPEGAYHGNSLNSLIENQHTHQTLGDVLHRQTGLYLKQYGVGMLSTPSFFGTSAAHTKLTYNGFELNSSLNGQFDLSLFPNMMFNRLNATHGSIYDGIGGSVNMGDEFNHDNHIEAAYHLGGGSFGQFSNGLHLSYGRNFWNSTTALSFARAANDFSFRDQFSGEDVVTENAGYERINIKQSISRGVEGNIFTLSGWYSANYRNIPTPMGVAPKLESQDDEAGRIYASWSGNHLRRIFMEYDLRTMVSIEELEYQNPSIGLVSNSSLLRWSTLGSLTFETPKFNYYFKFGQRHDWASSNGYEQDHERNNLNLGGGILYRSNHPVHKHRVKFMLKQEVIDTELAPIQLELEYSKRLYQVRNTEFFFDWRFARNYRFPTLNELHWQPGGNPNLKPELSHGSYVSFLIFQKNRLRSAFQYRTKLTGFFLHVNDWILWLPDNTAIWTPQNLKKVINYGVNIDQELSYRWIDQTVSLDLNYAFTKSKNLEAISFNDNSENKQLIYSPLHQFNYKLTYSIGQFKIWWGQQTTSKRFVTTDNTRFLDAFYLAETGVSYEHTVGKFAFTSGINFNNIFNAEYQTVENRPLPGFNFNLWLSVRFAQQIRN